ncbi:MAG: methyltransferase domain-containing protein [Bacteroidales bacterium]|nr:methyltransferase domain-containing protein [Bacteroidales bacterium]
MRDDFFTFKQFRVMHRKSIMKVGTDGVLLGAYVDCKNAKRILDIGTGTGLLCLMLAQKCDALIHGIDINDEAVEVAKFNVEQSKWSDRITVFQSSVQDFVSEGKYDLIVSNPPFYTTDVVAPEKGRALARHDLSLNISELAASICRLLSPDGRCYVIYPTEQCRLFEDEASKYGLFVLRRLYVSSRPDVPPIRTIVELSRKQCEPECDSLYIENGERHDFSDKYRSLTRDYYLKF